MEMSLTRISCALFPWLLCMSFLPSPVVASTADPAAPASASVAPPAAAAAAAANATLLFEGGAPGGGVRNCSCSAPVRPCDEALANLLCSCHTVPRSALPAGGLRAPGAGALTVWLREARALQELLNGSTVGHLRLALCGGELLTTQYLSLLGLRTLSLHNAAPGVPYPDQEITIAGPDSRAPAGRGGPPAPDAGPGGAPLLRLTFVDVALLNGRSALKAYSVEGPSLSSLALQFPFLPLSLRLEEGDAVGSPDPAGAAADGKVLLTFVY